MVLRRKNRSKPFLMNSPSSDLCLDLSGPRHSLAVCRGESVCEAVHFLTPRRATGPVCSEVKRLLDTHGTPSRILVGLGPGSYNGLRAALALAAGLEISTKTTVSGVSSLLILEGAPDGSFWVLGDARAAQFYIARVENRQFVEPPRLMSQAEALDCAASASDPVFRVGEHPLLGSLPVLFPSAELLPRAVGNAVLSPEFPSPIYLKPPHITPARSAGAVKEL